VLSLIGYYIETKEQNNSGEVILIIETIGTTITEKYNFSRASAIGLLKQNHEVKTILNDNFVECIDDICANSEYAWSFTVDNKSVNYGAKNYRLKDKDVVKFEFKRGG